MQACAALGVQARAREVHTLQRAVVVDNWEHQDPERPVEKGCRNGHKDGPAEAPVVPGRHRGIDGRTKGCAGRRSPTPPPFSPLSPPPVTTLPAFSVFSHNEKNGSAQ